VVRLFAAEAGATLRFTLEPEDMALAPGEERFARLRVRPTQVSALGPPKSLVFWAGALPFAPSAGSGQAEELAQPLAQAAAELLVLPRFTYVPPTGQWLLRVIPMLLVLLLIVLVLVLRFWPTSPTG